MEEPFYYPPPGRRPGFLLPLILFVITVITTIISGALQEGVNPFKGVGAFLRGVPFSASLLVILGTHELGHYFASKRHGVLTTLPFFIPGPPIPPMIGTFGAVIKMKSPITTKRALVDIGAAGPLAGFITAVVITIWGLKLSPLIEAPQGDDAIGLGSSLIFSLLFHLTVGTVPEGQDLFIQLHPMAFAGWIGLFITSINLLPIGQLDGGHIVYAIFGPYHRVVSMAMVLLLILLGLFTWPGWFVWAMLVTFLGIWHPPVINHFIPLDRKRKTVGIITFIVFVLTFIPTPFYII